MSKKILICGDSFGTTDIHYPGLHFTEKIKNTFKDFEIINLCRGGSSNALIEMQVHQGLVLAPDYVIVLFTNSHRTEYEISESTFFSSNAKLNHIHFNTPYNSIINFNNQKYLTSVFWYWNRNSIPKHDNIHGTIKAHEQLLRYGSDDFRIIKNYFSIIAVLNLLKIKNIPVCFNLGGIDNSDTQNKNTEYAELKNTLLPSHFLPNELENFMSHSTDINLWDHVTDHSSGPCFHVDDDKIQTAFANDCITKLGLL